MPGRSSVEFCERRDFKPTINFRSAQLGTIQALVCSSVGISLIPQWPRTARRKDMPEYRSSPRPPGPSEKSMAIWPKQRPPRPGGE